MHFSWLYPVPLVRYGLLFVMYRSTFLTPSNTGLWHTWTHRRTHARWCHRPCFACKKCSGL